MHTYTYTYVYIYILPICMYMCIYIYMCRDIYIYTYIYNSRRCIVRKPVAQLRVRGLQSTAAQLAARCPEIS